MPHRGMSRQGFVCHIICSKGILNSNVPPETPPSWNQHSVSVHSGGQGDDSTNVSSSGDLSLMVPARPVRRFLMQATSLFAKTQPGFKVTKAGSREQPEHDKLLVTHTFVKHGVASKRDHIEEKLLQNAWHRTSAPSTNDLLALSTRDITTTQHVEKVAIKSRGQEHNQEHRAYH